MNRIIFIFFFSLCTVGLGAQSLENNKKLFFSILNEALNNKIVEDAIFKQRNAEAYPLYLVYDHGFAKNFELEGFAVDTSKVKVADFIMRSSVLQVTSFQFDPENDAYRLKLQYNEVVKISVKASRVVKQSGKRISSILISTD